MASQHPQIGSWYEDRTLATVFEVVAIDDHAGTIELQYENGDIDELEIDEWRTGAFTVAAPPDDTLGIFGLEDDDNWAYELSMHEHIRDDQERYNFGNLPDMDEY